MKRSVLTFLASAALATLLGAEPACAQQSTTRGFNLGAHLGGSSLKVEDGDTRDDGAGGGIHVGYGFNRVIMLFLQIDGAGFMLDEGTIQGEWTMAHVDLGARFHFASSLRRWVPYLQGSLTGRGVAVQDPVVENDEVEEVGFAGGGFSGGGGLLFYLKETLALEAQLMVTGGEFNEFKINNVTVSGLEIDATSSRFNLGVSWWP
jgi:hypothetical protein